MGLPESPLGWVGDFSGFCLEEQRVVKGDSQPETVALTPLDLVLRGLAHTQIVYTITLPIHLDRDKFEQAVETLVASYPVLGGRLKHSRRLPAIHLSGEGIPVSFATWRHSSVASFTDAYHFRVKTGIGKAFVKLPLFAHELQVLDALHGKGPLYGLRLTHLDDGNSVIALTALHHVSDGGGLSKVLNGLAAAYRGDTASKWLPEPCLQTRLWPGDLAQYLPYPAALTGLEGPTTDDTDLDEEMLNTNGEYNIGDAHNLDKLFLPFIVPGYKDGTTVSMVTVHAAQEDLTQLKQRVAAHAMAASVPFISTMDVVQALAWLLSCENQGIHLPGQGPAGTVSKVSISVALAQNGLPAEALHPGFIGNTASSQPTTVIATGQAPEVDYCSIGALEDALAVTAVAIRQVILSVRQPGTAVAYSMACGRLTRREHFGSVLATTCLHRYVCCCTEWMGFENDMRFHDDQQRSWVNGHMDCLLCNAAALVRREGGVGIRLLCSDEGLGRLANSRVLQGLAPASGLLPGLAEALLGKKAVGGREGPAACPIVEPGAGLISLPRPVLAV